MYKRNLQLIMQIFFLFTFMQFYTISIGKPDKPSYFPMHIGDKWIYEHTELPNYVTTRFNFIEIIDTVTINNKKYYINSEIIGSYWGYEDPFYGYTHLDELNQVWHYNPKKNTEEVNIGFNLQLGQTIVTKYDTTNHFTYTLTLMDTNATVETPAGIFRHCLYLQSEIVEIFTDFRDWYAPNVGLVLVHSEGEGLTLYGACINGVVYGDTSKSVPDQITQSGTKQVNDLHLQQNYPNPFNSSTEIQYSLQNKGYVQLLIYNLQGQLVRAFASGYCQPGEYAARWNGCTDSGAPLASGIYFYRLILDGQAAATKRLVMVK